MGGSEEETRKREGQGKRQKRRLTEPGKHLRNKWVPAGSMISQYLEAGLGF